MEYHADRFDDFSLLIFKNEKLVAVFPANVKDGVVYSHQGLTYGGLLLPFDVNFDEVTAIFNTMVAFLKRNGIDLLIVKEMPKPYHKQPSDEVAYWMHKFGSILDTQLVLAVDYGKPIALHKTKRKYHRQGSQKGLEIRKETNFEAFWNMVLTPRLAEKHKASPVHSLAEIELLHSRFPDKIYQYNVYLEDELLAGITVFETDQVVKSQYGATTAKGEQLRAFDYLFVSLILQFQDQKKYFSQGTVTEKNELGYNPGLLKQKQELGCEVHLQRTFEISLQ
ncbi:hypothetical protein SAMN05216480_102282 [Pustulibacterium marinum]|uniref:FemAB family protein n=1 Tax=Pustulibacterium marinum TaxID=1224947 RepID=A0A1I7FVX7_9FLAO|nr:FemAB family protein [Pustulibacterium marinum]SFU40303.1 hypothetical protein SAMN05216480_102282 [Pustulibacterium marinum]